MRTVFSARTTVALCVWIASALGAASALSQSTVANSPTMNTANISPLSAMSALTPEEQARGIWIDVRTPAEFAQGHLAGATNVPLDVLVAQIERVVPDKNAQVRLYCRSGNRSGMAQQLLHHMGYTNLSNEGGYAQLKARGAQVVEPK